MDSSLHWLSASNSTLGIGLIVAGLSSSYFLYKTWHKSQLQPTAKRLRGPSNPSYIMGHFENIVDPPLELVEQWIQTYGLTLRLFLPLNEEAVYTADPRAATFVFNNWINFRKPDLEKGVVLAIAGPGVYAMEGEANRRQRRILNPAFSALQIKHLQPTMIQKAQELRDAWIKETGIETGSGALVEINVLDWLSHMALDIIGEVGFGYQFNTLRDHASGEIGNELANAFEKLVTESTLTDVIGVLGFLYPIIQKIPVRRNIVVRECRATMTRIGAQLVQDKKKELASVPSSDKELLLDKDILSALIRANLQESGDARMSDEEVLAQIATFLVAGHDTSSATMAWALYSLSKTPHAQAKLREEVRAFPHDNPDFDELNTLTYLDWVVRETLRIHTPAPYIQRVPFKDAVIPLSTPVPDKYGKMVNEICLPAGHTLIISAGGLNWCTRIWGPDALEFKPERYANLPEAVLDIPSLYGNNASFISGPRGCIGYKFALAEVKSVLFTLIRCFDFDIDPSLVVGKRTTVVARPFIEGDADTRCKLPLKVSLRKDVAG